MLSHTFPGLGSDPGFFLEIWAGSVSAQVAHCYPEHMASFPQQLKELLSYHHTVLDADLRMVRPTPKGVLSRSWPVVKLCPLRVRSAFTICFLIF